MFEQFHIRTDWPVLVVEDTEDRISWFRGRRRESALHRDLSNLAERREPRRNFLDAVIYALIGIEENIIGPQPAPDLLSRDEVARALTPAFLTTCQVSQKLCKE
jgi:hypothetical protein